MKASTTATSRPRGTVLGATILVVALLVLGVGWSSQGLADDSGYTDTAVDGCMEDVAGFGLNCTANDIQIANVTNVVILDADGGCAYPGDTVTFTADYEVLLTAQARHDIGLWFATDGDPNGDGAITGQCTVGTPAYAPDPPWLDLDGTGDTFLDSNVVSNIQDTCGDIDATHNPLFPSMTITAQCIAGPDGDLSLPSCTSWKQPGDNDLCTSPLPVADVGGPGLDSSGVPPGAPSKCRCEPGFTVPIRVPAFITVDKVTVDNNGNPLPGDPTLFDFSITGPDTDLPDDFSLADADAIHTSPPLDTKDEDGNTVGPYQVTETEPAGWDLVSASCTRDNATPNDTSDDTTFVYTNGSNIQPKGGEVIDCTFTNKLLKTTPTVATEIHLADETAVVFPYEVDLGSTVHDKATVTGVGATPTGDATFYFYDNDTCSDPPVATSGLFSLSGGSVDATTFTQGPLAAGAYAFKAHYWGDTYYFEADSPCEPLTVNQAASSTVTEIHLADESAVIFPYEVALGSTVHDQATVSGIVAFVPTGNVAFTFYSGGDCETGTEAAAGTVALVSGVAHPSDAFGPLPAGDYAFQAYYAGDGNYTGSTSACEPLTVVKADTETTTEIHLDDESVVSGPVALGSTVHDQATVTGTGAGTPTGDATFYWYTNNTCSGDPVDIGTVALVDGVAHPSASRGPLAAGNYAFKAHYNGDLNYNESDSLCEPLTVDKADITLLTTIHNAADYSEIPLNSHVPLGTSAYDVASFSGANPNFAPTIANVTYTFDGAASGSGAQSNTQGPLGAKTGSYVFAASFSGDDNYNAADSADEPFYVDKADITLLTTIHNAADYSEIPLNSHVPLGTSAYDVASFSGANPNFAPTIANVTYTFDGAASGSGAQSNTQGPLGAKTGSYVFAASFSGDDNYNAADSADEPFYVDKADITLLTTIHNAADYSEIPLNSHVPLGTSAYDVASFSGANPNFAPTIANVTYTFDGAAAGSGAQSNTQGPLGAKTGSYVFAASFSGDDNYNAADSADEPFYVDKADITLLTTIHNATDYSEIPLNSHVPLGTSAYDVASFSGANPNFAPTIANVTYTFDGAASGSGAQSNTQGPLGAKTGSYVFAASFSGDDNYNAADSADEPFYVDKADITLLTTIHNAADYSEIPLNSHVPLGTSAYDVASFQGSNPNFTPTIANVTYTFDGAASGSGAQSNTQGPLGAKTGSYVFAASFSGDDNYNAADSADEPFYVDKADITLLTTIHNAADYSEIPLNSHVPLGTSAYDVASFQGSNPNFTPTIANVTYTFDGAASGSGAQSNTQGPLGAKTGSYVFAASFSGDDNYNAADSADEPFYVDKADITLLTTIHNAADYSEIPLNSHVPLGTSAYDVASFSGANPNFAPTIANVTYTFDGAAAGSGAQSNTQGPLGAKTGSYVFAASFSGDDNYNAADSADEPFYVDKADITLLTTIHNAADYSEIPLNSHVPLGTSAYDVASFSGANPNFAPTIANVTYTFDGAASGSGAQSNTQGPLGAKTGSYVFAASFSGDDNYNAADSADEPFYVDKADITLLTTIHNAADYSEIPLNSHVPLGTSAYDVASFQGSNPNFTPTIANVTYTFDGAASGSGAQSNTQGPLGAKTGSYVFAASFSGDDNYNAADSADEPFYVDKADITLLTTIHNAADGSEIPLNSHVDVGTSAYDVASFSGANPNFAPTIANVTYTFDGAASGSGAQSNTQGPLDAGHYVFAASFSGDDNYNAADSADEPFDVDKAEPTITTLADPTNVVLGQETTVGDTATLHDAYNPTGSILFTLYSDDQCTVPAGVSGSGTIDEYGVASYSALWTPDQTGTYYWIAHYDGDPNNEDFTTGCGDANEMLSVSPPIAVTDSALCQFGGTFRDILSMDPKLISFYKETATNPGQFYYNLSVSGTPGEIVEVTLSIPWPFVTQGARPIHVYDGVTLEYIEGTDYYCFVPGEEEAAIGNYIVLSDYGVAPYTSGYLDGVSYEYVEVVLEITIPDTGFAYINQHMDYGLKGLDTDFSGDGTADPQHYVKDANDDALLPDYDSPGYAADPPVVLIPEGAEHPFCTFEGETELGCDSAFKDNDWKFNPGIAGQVIELVTNGAGDGIDKFFIEGAFVELIDRKRNVVGQDYSDQDGWYQIVYKHKGRPSNYTFKATLDGITFERVVELKGNEFEEVNVYLDSTGGGVADYVHIASGVTKSKVTKTWNATAEMLVVDQNDNPVANAQVSGGWDTGDAGLCISDAEGWCTVALKKLPLATGSVTFTVIDIAAEGYLFDADASVVVFTVDQ